MIYVFCGAYKALLMALYFKNVLGDEITIITNNLDVVKYCESEKIEFIHFEYVKPSRFSLISLFDLYKVKKKLDSIINNITLGKDDCYILTAKAISFESFYLAKELAKKGKVYTKIIHREFKIYKKPRSKPFFIRGSIFKIFIKLIFDLNLMYYEANKDPRYGIDNKFLKRHNINEYPLDLHTEKMILEAVKRSKSKLYEYENLIIDQGPIENQVSLDSVRKLYKNLFELPLEFAFKRHPNPSTEYRPIEKSYYKLFKHCEELPSYVPVELFLNNIKNNAISLCSAALITASQMDHIKAISLIDLIEWRHPEYKEEFKNHLIKQSNNRIIFPANFEELKDILLNK